MPLLRDPTVAISRLQNVIMWGDNLWQKFVICFSICFFTIWISTLATWVTIYTARQEGQGSLTAPFNKAVCGNLKDEIGQVATKTGPAGTNWADGITMTADSKWRPTVYGRVQTPSASIKEVELQTACPAWNRDGALFVQNKLMSYTNSRGLTETYNGIKGVPADNMADFTIADCNNSPQFVLKFFAQGATAPKYNLPAGVTAALVIKNASSCTSNPCDFESASYPTVAFATPLANFNESPTKFWQGGKQYPIVIKGMDGNAVANLQISVNSPQTIGAELVGNYAAIGLGLDHLILIGGKGIWTDGGKYYFTNPRDMDYKSYSGGCMNTCVLCPRTLVYHDLLYFVFGSLFGCSVCGYVTTHCSYMGAFVSSWVFLAFFIAVIILMIVICIARRCCAKKSAAAADSGAAVGVDMEAPKPVVPIRMN